MDFITLIGLLGAIASVIALILTNKINSSWFRRIVLASILDVKGYALSALGRYEEAIQAYNKFIEIKPDSYIVWTSKGNALFKVGRHDEALEAYNKSIEIKPDFEYAWKQEKVPVKKMTSQFTWYLLKQEKTEGNKRT